jgi:anti-anti-sigma regulatory factor
MSTQKDDKDDYIELLPINGRCSQAEDGYIELLPIKGSNSQADDNNLEFSHTEESKAQVNDNYIKIPQVEEHKGTDPLQEEKSVNPSVNSYEIEQTPILEETTLFLQEILPAESRFRIRYSKLKDEHPIIIVLHCSGNIVGSNCLVLHNTFKMCIKNFPPFIIVDMSNVSSIDKQVWEYFSSRSTKIQKLNGILLFSGIRTDVLSETTDFHKMNICHCQTIDLCCKVIRNLVSDHEKIRYFEKRPNNRVKSEADQVNETTIQFSSNNSQEKYDSDIDSSTSSNKTTEIEREGNALNTNNSNNSEDAIVIEDAYESTLYVDESMSTDYSLIIGKPTQNDTDVDSSLGSDYSIFLEKQNESINVDETMSVVFSTNLKNMSNNNLNGSTGFLNNGKKDIEEDDLTQSIDNQYLNENFKYPNENNGNIEQSSRLIFNSNEYTLSEKIHIIISQNGPGSFGSIMKKLHSKEFGKETINAFSLYNLLKSMNLESTKKRIRYYRTC